MNLTMNPNDDTLARQAIRPVDLPEIVRLIAARIPLEERARARYINRTWNANVTYTVDEKQTLLMHATGPKHSSGYSASQMLEAVDRLLDDPRVDPSSDENSAMLGALFWGHVEVIDRLLQDPRVDPSENDN